MRLHFYKMHLGGNSFILIDTEAEKDLKLADYSDFTRKICNKRFGVGASGCIFLDEKNNLRVFTPDGLEAKDFYDALFCATRYAFDSGRLTKAKNGDFEICFNTLKGEKKLKVLSSREFEISMGSPFELSSGKIIKPNSPNPMETIDLEGQKVKMSGIHVFADCLVTSPKSIASKPFFLLYTKIRELLKPNMFYLVASQAVTRETLCIRTIKRGTNTSCASAASALVNSVLTGASESAAVCIFAQGNKSLLDQQAALAEDTDDSKKITVLWDEKDNSLRLVASGGYLFEGFYVYNSKKESN